MNTRDLYNQWSSSYDEVENKTRDLEKIAGQRVLTGLNTGTVIELGCGTGKNTSWLAEAATHLTAVDFSEDMMAVAKGKIRRDNVVFQQADISQPWTFTDRKADLVTCSLILEHIEDLHTVFQQVRDHLRDNGHFYVCELHPFKQYSGSKARFDTPAGTKVLRCYVHHLTDYLEAAAASSLSLADVREWFDNEDRSGMPRLISFLFRR